MCSGDPPKVEQPPPMAPPPTQVDADVQGARSREKDRMRAASGRSSTILTGGGGLQGNANTGKTILGA